MSNSVLLKALVYRILATSVTAGGVWLLTGQGDLAVAVMILDFCAKLFGYALFETAWRRVMQNQGGIK